MNFAPGGYSCNPQFFSELITTQLREFHMVLPQVVFTLLILLTINSYKFYVSKILKVGCHIDTIQCMVLNS